MARTFWSEVEGGYHSKDGRVSIRPVKAGGKRSWTVTVDGELVWSNRRLDTAKQYGLEYRDGLHRSFSDE